MKEIPGGWGGGGGGGGGGVGGADSKYGPDKLTGTDSDEERRTDVGAK